VKRDQTNLDQVQKEVSMSSVIVEGNAHQVVRVQEVIETVALFGTEFAGAQGTRLWDFERKRLVFGGK
jgi:hypothetical protein